MCGFAGVFGEGDGESDLMKVQMMLDRIRHRGPDDRGIVHEGTATLGQHGLAVIDLDSDRQPLSDDDGLLWIVGDVEAYGFETVRQRYNGTVGAAGMETEVAAEAILRLYDETGPGCVEHIDGAFAFAVYDKIRGELFVARDPLGVKPLYYGFDEAGAFCFASEIKGLLAATRDVRPFPPGHFWTSRRGFVRFFRLSPPKTSPEAEGYVDDAEEAVERVRDALARAVHKRLETDAPLGAFVSGGLDSSLIAAMAVEEQGPLPSFAVGMEGSPDLTAARFVAEHLGTDHHEHVITPGEIRAVLPATIYHLESYDPALVRGAIANYFAARLASEHVKVVLVGEGADELFAGYEYLKELDVDKELPHELHDITRGMYNEGLQRLDRLTAAHSLASRPPFLDGELVDLAFRIDPRLKMYGRDKVEKWVLRKAAEDYLPESIIWREKEKFAAGAGTDDVLTDLAEELVSDEEFEAAQGRAEGGEVLSREEWMYYQIYRRFFPTFESASVATSSRGPH